MLAGPKMYCVHAHNEDIKKVCKGMPSHYVKENFYMNVYRNGVEKLITRASVMAIRSLKFKNYKV